jgi:hypothetical protein
MSCPRIITVTASRVDAAPEIGALVLETRAQADAFIFLSGGAAKMSTESEDALLGLFDAFAILGGDGLRFAVADGGTRAGIMQAAGRARTRSVPPFPLIGVSPAREIPPHGSTPVDPNHSVIVAVENLDWDGADGYFGSETVAMYWLFDRLAEGRPSVTVVANGGAIALTEVDQNVRAGRSMILVRGSGRAADALASMLNPALAVEGEAAELRAKAERLSLLRRPNLLHTFDIASGPDELARMLRRFLTR